MQITITELQLIWEKVITHMRESGHDTVEIENDFYWDISEEQRYYVYDQPTDFVMGQLSDDWEELLKVLETQDDTSLTYNLVWLASILRAIGEKVIA
jgi:hypothetical protein